jgi:hypothetical protein
MPRHHIVESLQFPNSHAKDLDAPTTKWRLCGARIKGEAITTRTFNGAVWLIYLWSLNWEVLRLYARAMRIEMIPTY